MKEKLSAFLDGELGDTEARELLFQLDSDKELRAVWDRYHLAGSALRGEFAQFYGSSLAASISNELKNEPQILVPGNRWRHSGTKFFKMAGSLAIAASVATIAIISMQVDTRESAGTQNIAKLTPITSSDFIRTRGTRWSKGTSTTEKALNMYLVEHGEFNPSSNFKGMMSYGHIVSYDMTE